ncbi:HAD-IA family hydrolase [Legionella longbeachae]|uniref:Haloacid dehalogenase-like hydrolase n=2 Tax=Legionella longbeachae TaxID=450 RepID=D3HSR6_LEGLN|nr:HAD-IA family hydrolase [Legionella longbeachae]VEE02449.1 haloacid dehalogenase [Legionella oakridgensis]HBD7398064.1 HAD-IA family hydrolase [Legionella pneumophila]ARB91274.1 haloacid dehalogenase [Legionella longbeachae]ARM32301.1 HAD-IA family hydrolase [Legionella longbeachae]EEZ94906.1 HAD-superfamily hydrolase family protein [Legionella longbeachae D-4968]
MSYQVILFDLDDTLIDFSHSERMGLISIYNQFYSSVEYSVFEHLYKEINTQLWQKVGDSLSSSEVRLLRFTHLNQKLSCSTPIEEIAIEYEKNLCAHAYWLPHVKDAIEFLHQKGHFLGIITNGFTETQVQKHQQLELYNWFDSYVISSEIGVAKPNIKIFEIAIAEIICKRQYCIEKNSMLMVGDSIISDGHGAKNFGIDFCFINNHSLNVLPTELPIKYNINSVAHLPICMGYKAEYESFLETYKSMTV